MRRIRALLSKEWAHHGWFFIATLPILGFVIAMLLYAQSRAEMGSALNAPRFFAMSILILFQMIVCNRLVVQEFSGKTQLFLESLPLSRVSMIATKYFLGFIVCVLPLAACFGIALLLQARVEVLSSRFASIVSLRLAAFVFCTYSFFFMMGLLGRYRIAIYLLLLLIVMMLDQQTDFSFRQSGPLALLNDQFPFERQVFPWDEIKGCGIAGGVFVTVAMLMSTLREGGVAAMLAERMTAREKSFLTIGLLTVMFASSTLDAKKIPPPYDFDTPWSINEDDVQVKVGESIDQAIADDLLSVVHSDLVSIKNYLQIKEMPPVFLVGRDDLDGSEHEVATLVNAAGVMFRINPSAEDWDEQAFRSYVLDVALSEASNYNAIHERQCWVLEGFVQYWIAKQEQSLSIQDLRSAYGADLGFSPTDADAWYSYRERVGQPIASAVACRGLQYAESEFGADAVQGFLRDVLRTDLPEDARALWTQWRRPIERSCRDHFGVEYQSFLDQWSKNLHLNLAQNADEISKVPCTKIETTVEAPAGLTRRVNVTVTMSPPPSDGLIKLEYEEIGVVNMWESDEDLADHILDYENDAVITIPESYSPGDRIRVRATTFSETLQCDVASPWKRMEIQ